MKMNQLFKAAIMALVMSSAGDVYGQGMAVNTSGSPADGSAILDVTSNTQGMLVPRMTDAQRAGISSPATGLLVYQTNGATGFYYNSGTPGSPVWVSLNALSNVTTQGNSFNGTSQLVQTNVSGQLPALSGANLTSLAAGNITAGGTLPALNGAALTSLSAGNITSGGTLPTLNGAALTNLSGGNITNSTVTVAKISATGTPGATTFLSGNGVWSTPLTLTTAGSGAATFAGGVLNIPTPSGGGGSASLQLYATLNGSSTTASQTNGTTIDVNYNNSVISPTAGIGSYDGTVYTVGASGAGVYLITASLPTQSSGTVIHATALLLNNTAVEYGTTPAISTLTPSFYTGNPVIVSVLSLVSGDKLKVQSLAPSGAAATTSYVPSPGAAKFTITKLN